MKFQSFLIPRRKVIELCLLPIFLVVAYFIWPEIEVLSLFAFGYIWNWTASNDLTALFEDRRYRMSMLKMVVNLQNLILKPFGWAPEIVKRIIRVLPAGIFWYLVIYLNESHMPWWATFLGSAVFELLLLEISLFKKHKESV
ncbi:type 1 glutamine amidotransferase family protein [Peredibacter starrii]|uniref:Uncharacterized protein n=1 Tax=Peredibacter starrii TaxID=28202 RepID=A0AAX4HQQ5_9BACT|nr:hypothetical protein [Peredibacter starrii]WPU65668.1 hypothetical protein SOO65_02815 [Peredibacter starrii]